MQARVYVKGFAGQTKWMYFLIEDDDLLEKYNISWDKHPRLDFFLSSR